MRYTALVSMNRCTQIKYSNCKSVLRNKKIHASTSILNCKIIDYPHLVAMNFLKPVSLMLFSTPPPSLLSLRCSSCVFFFLLLIILPNPQLIFKFPNAAILNFKKFRLIHGTSRLFTYCTLNR